MPGNSEFWSGVYEVNRSRFFSVMYVRGRSFKGSFESHFSFESTRSERESNESVSLGREFKAG